MAKNKSPVLVCWIGGNDLKAATGGLPGPIFSTLRAANFSRVELLCSYPRLEMEAYRDWLAAQTPVPLAVTQVPLISPVDFAEIYEAAEQHLRQLQTAGESLAILLSPGTAAMQAVWILLGKTRYPAIFYQSSLEHPERHLAGG
ncbi:MAG: hypothetical protein ACOX0Y_08020 [Thiopseudomonas sp.]